MKFILETIIKCYNGFCLTMNFLCELFILVITTDGKPWLVAVNNSHTYQGRWVYYRATWLVQGCLWGQDCWSDHSLYTHSGSWNTWLALDSFQITNRRQAIHNLRQHIRHHKNNQGKNNLNRPLSPIKICHWYNCCLNYFKNIILNPVTMSIHMLDSWYKAKAFLVHLPQGSCCFGWQSC